MKNFILSISCIFIVINSFSSCKEETISDIETETVVVQSYLYASYPVDSFRVTQSISYTSTSDEIITLDDLTISLNDGTNTYFLEPMGSGYYKNSDLIISEGKNYFMEFEKNNNTITASTYIPEKREISISTTSISVEKVSVGVMMPPTQTDPITISWDNPEGDYYYVLVENIESDPEYINDNFATGNRGDRRFLTEPTVSAEHNVDTRRDIQFFGTYQVVVYRVNPEYAALYSTAESTSSSIVEPSSNIENGLGIMTGISTDTIHFEVKEL